MLGTFVEIAAVGLDATAIDAAFSAVARVHAAMSFHEETSDLARLRQAAVGATVIVAEDTVSVLYIALDLHRRSNGLFDVAIGATMVARNLLPCPPGLRTASMPGTAADIEILDGRHVRCHRPMLIDLGGIAKGHAVDRAAEVLIAAGAEQAIVNAGGDLRVIGGTPQRIALRGADGLLDTAIDLADAALASSGGDAFVDVAAPQLDQGCRPVKRRGPVTVVADRCIIADAMTKVVLADPELAAVMLADLGGASVVRQRPTLVA